MYMLQIILFTDCDEKKKIFNKDLYSNFLIMLYKSLSYTDEHKLKSPFII